MTDVLRATLQWVAFPFVLIWVCLIYLPGRLLRWLAYGDTPQQARRRQQRKALRRSEWQAIEHAMVSELQARKWPDTPRYRSILLSGRWGKR
jgi:hypothetical protein